MAITARLGVWQLSRASQKHALQAQIEAQSLLPAWDTRALLSAPQLSDGHHRRVVLDGQWIPGSSVYLDNRQMGARNGFFLITALRLSSSERAVLVQRGWVPRDFQDRARVPAVPLPGGEVQIEGRLAPGVAQLYELGAAVPGPIRQNIQIESYAREKGLLLIDGLVLQTGPDADGLLREWPVVTVDVSKHHGYAFQWFALCALVGVLYLWFQVISPRRKRNTHGTNAR